jgi:hypothetical protein
MAEPYVPGPPGLPPPKPVGMNRTPHPRAFLTEQAATRKAKAELREARRARQAEYQRKSLAKKKAAAAQAKAIAPVSVMLTQEHYVNNVRYGPGAVMVPPPLAAVLQEQERNAARGEANFMDRQPVVTLMTVDRRLYRYPHGTDLNSIMGRF